MLDININEILTGPNISSLFGQWMRLRNSREKLIPITIGILGKNWAYDFLG